MIFFLKFNLIFNFVLIFDSTFCRNNIFTSVHYNRINFGCDDYQNYNVFFFFSKSRYDCLKNRYLHDVRTRFSHSNGFIILIIQLENGDFIIVKLNFSYRTRKNSLVGRHCMDDIILLFIYLYGHTLIMMFS